jgi:hypothetical protein
MKRLLFFIICLFYFNCTHAKNQSDSILITPQPIRNYMYLQKKGYDSMKFNLFLFTMSGRMVSAMMNSDMMDVRELQSGNYVLEIFGLNNEFKYRYFIYIEN